MMTFFFTGNILLAQTFYIEPPNPYSKNISNEKTIDSARIRILYAFNATDINDYKTYDDLQRLEIGSTLSKYYSFFVYNSDSLCTDYENKKPRRPNEGARPEQMGEHGKKKRRWLEYLYSEIFKDFSTDLQTQYIQMPLMLQSENCYYSENISLQEWEIHEDTMMVCSYLCQKATCTFRGRNYVAWFTMDIPVSNGPWKFGGLPGLILKIYDTELLFVFECIGVEIHNEKYPIRKLDYSRYNKIKRENALRLIKKIHENWGEAAGMVITEFFPPAGKSLSEDVFKKKEHKPLELE